MPPLCRGGRCGRLRFANRVSGLPIWRWNGPDTAWRHVVDETGFDTALVLIHRSAALNAIHVARAWNAVAQGGRIVVAGDNKSAIKSLRKRLGDHVTGSVSKHHAVAFTLERNGPDWPVPDRAMVAISDTGAYATQAGTFSADRVDAGSQLLVRHFDSSLRGCVADFGAGWGYLSAELLARAPGVGSMVLYEADFAALEAARTNLAAWSEIADFKWMDVAGEFGSERFNHVIMNPPFHTDRAADPALGQAFIKAAARALMPGGSLLMVANRNLPYEATLADSFQAVRDAGGRRRLQGDAGVSVRLLAAHGRHPRAPTRGSGAFRSFQHAMSSSCGICRERRADCAVPDPRVKPRMTAAETRTPRPPSPSARPEPALRAGGFPIPRVRPGRDGVDEVEQGPERFDTVAGQAAGSGAATGAVFPDAGCRCLAGGADVAAVPAVVGAVATAQNDIDVGAQAVRFSAFPARPAKRPCEPLPPPRPATAPAPAAVRRISSPLPVRRGGCAVPQAPASPVPARAGCRTASRRWRRSSATRSSCGTGGGGHRRGRETFAASPSRSAADREWYRRAPAAAFLRRSVR